jgi:hypothetical protein
VRRLLFAAAALLTVACGQPAGDAPPPDDNQWIVGDPATCTVKADLEQEAQDTCAAYGGQWALYTSVDTPCVLWFTGFAGLYEAPGFHTLTFECRP